MFYSILVAPRRNTIGEKENEENSVSHYGGRAWQPFWKGIKQLAKVGPAGEIIMEYSIHDALEAGFNKVVFIIRKDIEKEFKEIIGDKIEKITEVAYVYQDRKICRKGLPARKTEQSPGEPGKLFWRQKRQSRNLSW